MKKQYNVIITTREAKVVVKDYVNRELVEVVLTLVVVF